MIIEWHGDVGSIRPSHASATDRPGPVYDCSSLLRAFCEDERDIAEFSGIGSFEPHYIRG